MLSFARIRWLMYLKVMSRPTNSMTSPTGPGLILPARYISSRTIPITILKLLYSTAVICARFFGRWDKLMYRDQDQTRNSAMRCWLAQKVSCLCARPARNLKDKTIDLAQELSYFIDGLHDSYKAYLFSVHVNSRRLYCGLYEYLPHGYDCSQL